MLDTNKGNGAVEQLTQAIADSYKALADRTVALQDQNVHLALDMINAQLDSTCNSKRYMLIQKYHIMRYPRSVGKE